MASPSDRSSSPKLGPNPSSSTSSQATLTARTRKASSNSLASLPNLLSQPPALRPAAAAGANVALDLSPASAAGSPSSLSGARAVQGTVARQDELAAQAGGGAPGTSVGADKVWRSSAARRAEKAWALQTEKALYSDAKFKKYAAMVERTLATFDNVSEWADFISFLSRLLKTFQAYPQFNVIPRKLIVAKRLSQCLNPALPSGVHQRALDAYAHILGVIGPDGLRRDLQIWSPGLLPFFQAASTSVKPTLLSIYEKHYLPLAEDLRPVMRALLLALLPGLEEETGEFFERVMKLLERAAGGVGRSFFLQNIWLVLIGTPGVRLAALNYLSRRMPRLNDEPDPAHVVGQDLGLMARGFAHALDDENLLVRRATLELLVSNLRMDSKTFQKAMKEPDRVLLVGAALGVVLRRDLSLNRRLYTWLLGPGETAEAQQFHLDTHGLALVHAALQRDFYGNEQSDSAERQRPYKIFISLLDKWEIGQPLTAVLVLDAFDALTKQVTGAPDDELATTANMLFEIVDPFVTYRQFFLALNAHFRSESSASNGSTEQPESAVVVEEKRRTPPVELLRSVLSLFRVHDDESRQIHLPLLFSVLLELADSVVAAQGCQAWSDELLSTLELANEILALIPPRVYARAHEATATADNDNAEEQPDESFLKRAQFSYEPRDASAEQAGRRFVGFNDARTLAKLVALSARLTQSGSGPAAEERRGSQTLILCCALRIFGAFFEKLDEAEGVLASAPVTGLDMRQQQALELEQSGLPKVEWDARNWVEEVLGRLRKATAFIEVVHIVETLVKASQCRALANPPLLDNRDTIRALIGKLFEYLQPSMSPYHVRVVKLFWSVQALSRTGHVEAVVANQLSSKQATLKAQAFDAFGVLWRLTDDSALPGVVLHQPILLVLDALRSPDPSERQLGETFMRCNLRSYLRVLDPLLHILLDQRTRGSNHVREYGETRVEGFVYERPFDHERVNYTLATVLAVARFGGQGFAKTARGTMVRKSFDRHLAKSVEMAGYSLDSSYLEVLLGVLLRLLRSEPADAYRGLQDKVNTSTHGHVVDILQVLASRGALDQSRLKELEVVLIERIITSVYNGTVDRQNKMLHVLHTVIHALVSGETRSEQSMRRQPTWMSTPDTISGREDSSAAPAQTGSTPNPLLLRMIVVGLSTRTNRPVLQHWVDFVLMMAPYYRRSLAALLLPINDCICGLLRSGMSEIERVYAPGTPDQGQASTANTSCETTDAEVMMLINASERVLLLCLDESSLQTTVEDDLYTVPERGPDSATGLLGYVSNVFAPDASSSTSATPAVTNTVMRNLQQTVRTMHSIWVGTASPLSDNDAKSQAFANIVSKVRGRCRRALERLYRSQSGEVVEALIDCWYSGRSATSQDDVQRMKASFEILEILSPSAQIVVTFLCDLISTRTSPSGDKGKRSQLFSTVSEGVLFVFLESYIARLEGPIAVQVWPVVIMLVKDFLANSTAHKLQIFPTLRCFTTIGEKVCQTSALEDRRMRRDLQDNYLKMVDLSILISGRSFDQSTWMRRSGRDSTIEIPPDAEGAAVEKPGTPVIEASGTGLINSINEFLAARALPCLRKFLIDNDKINSICSSAVYYIVAPAFRTKSKTLDFDPVVLDIVAEMAKLPGTLKAWRTQVAEAFQDNRFFNCTPATSEKWRPLIFALMSSDKERFTELLGKVTAAPSANIFTNRELEMLSRALNLRRLSYVIYSGKKNHFLPQLPSIQEKLVDILRTNVAELVHSEVYLCLRILLCRFSTQHLSSFWPVIITELMRLFEGLLEELPMDGSDHLHVVLSACKFLDLLLTLQTEDFQIHQWMFVTDTVDVIYPPDDWMAESIIDRLAMMINEQRPVQKLTSEKTTDPFSQLPSPGSNPWNSRDSLDGGMTGLARLRSGSTTSGPTLRRPMLTYTRNVPTIGSLGPFFHHLSLASYESVYASVGVDWAAVEEGLTSDMFEVPADAQ